MERNDREPNENSDRSITLTSDIQKRIADEKTKAQLKQLDKAFDKEKSKILEHNIPAQIANLRATEKMFGNTGISVRDIQQRNYEAIENLKETYLERAHDILKESGVSVENANISEPDIIQDKPEQKDEFREKTDNFKREGKALTKDPFHPAIRKALKEQREIYENEKRSFELEKQTTLENDKRSYQKEIRNRNPTPDKLRELDAKTMNEKKFLDRQEKSITRKHRFKVDEILANKDTPDKQPSKSVEDKTKGKEMDM